MPPPAQPRIVFFGPPNAGKTALLSAFLHAADAAVPLTPAEGGPRDVIPHAVPPDAESAAGCVLVDTDGRTAANLIAHPDRFRPRPTRREPTSVTAAVYEADALVLLIDASADDAEIDRLFHDFGRFLDRLESARTTQREVGGLPVFLTLTKCDALRRPGDDPTEWLARVEARQQAIRTRFEEYLAEADAGAGPLGFGSIDVSVAATALRFPAAEGFAALGEGPFGVEDLFHESRAAAQAFRRRREQSGRRLQWTLSGSAALLGVMALGLGALLTMPDAAGDPLAARVRAFRDRSGPPAERLADRVFSRNENELVAIRESASFGRLPSELQAYVEEELREFTAYKEFRDRFRPPRLGPADVRSRGELDRLAAELVGELAPPPEYAAAWADTEAGQLWRKWQTDAALLRRSEETLYEWYRGLIRRATALQLGPVIDSRWRQDVAVVQADAAKPPFPADAPVPGSPRIAVRRGAALTYTPAFEFDRIAVARQDWENERSRLLNLRGLADALGLTSGPGTPPAVLDLPEPGPDEAVSRSLPGDRLKTLRDAYPSPAGDYTGWAASRFPDPVQKELRDRLERVFDTGVRHARRLIRGRLGGAAEAPAAWQSVVPWLETDPAMKDWGQLLGLIRRLADDRTGDPVAELAAFLRRDRFDAEVRSVEVTTPDDLRGRRAFPAGPFVISVRPASGPAVEYRYRPEGEPARVGTVSVARFVADGHDGKIPLRPGDDVTGGVTLRAGTQDFRLAWVAGRSGTYTFDRLTNQPEIRRPDENTPGERATGVRLLLLPENGWPAIPALLP